MPSPIEPAVMKRLPRSRTERLVGLSLLTALALLASLIEGRFPLPFPGLRLGVANVFTLTALVLLGPRAAVTVALLKISLAFLLTGNIFALACSAAGTLTSLPLAIFLYRRFRDELSLPALSVASATAFNVGQILAVVLMTAEPLILGYLPLLLAAGSATGFAVGALADQLSRRLAGMYQLPSSRHTHRKKF